MTIGTGIFSSVILLLIALAIWQITRHHKWKIAAKYIGICLAALAAIGAAIYGWQYIANLPPAPAVVTELSGIKLGASPTEVTLLFGKPDTITDPTIQNKETTFSYTYGSPEIRVVFYGVDKYRAVAQIICTADANSKLLGFNLFDNKKDIIERLGKPDSTSISRDGLSEFISYSKWKAAFRISKGLITHKCATSTGAVSFGEELLSPEEQKIEDQKAAIAAATARIADEARARDLANSAARDKPKRPSPRAGADSSPVGSDSGDPCAPSLSRAERLRRLASFGNVRETSDGDYQAGGHEVYFLYADKLLSCR